MTESQKTNAFLKKVQAMLPDAVIFKHNDRITAGIPDASISRKGTTMWIEFKDGTKIPEHQRLIADRMGNVYFYDHKKQVLQRFGGPALTREVSALAFILWRLT